jgi:hypothetical protein
MRSGAVKTWPSFMASTLLSRLRDRRRRATEIAELVDQAPGAAQCALHSFKPAAPGVGARVPHCVEEQSSLDDRLRATCAKFQLRPHPTRVGNKSAPAGAKGAGSRRDLVVPPRSVRANRGDHAAEGLWLGRQIGQCRRKLGRVVSELRGRIARTPVGCLRVVHRRPGLVLGSPHLDSGRRAPLCRFRG